MKDGASCFNWENKTGRDMTMDKAILMFMTGSMERGNLEEHQQMVN